MNKTKTDIEKSALLATETISTAAKAATAAIAEAALSATKLLAVQASEAAKVTNTKGSDDHDFLLTFSTEVKTRLDDLKTDIKDLQTNTTGRIDLIEQEKLNIKDSYPILYKAEVEKTLDDHEKRIITTETAVTRLIAYGTALIFLVGGVEFFINRFVK